MNANERVIVGMILESLNNGGTLKGLWNLLHVNTQNKIKSFLGINPKIEVIDLGTDSRKMKAVNAFQELLK